MENLPDKKAEISRLFMDIKHGMKHSMRKHFMDLGITMPQGMVIGSLIQNGDMKISELSKNIGLSNSTISGIIDRLEKQKIVERVRSEEDKRIVYVKLTANLSEFHYNCKKKGEVEFAKILEKGTPEEIDKIIEGLNILKRLITDTDRR